MTSELFTDIASIIAAIDELAVDMAAEAHPTTMSTTTATKLRNMIQDLYKIQSIETS